MGWRDFERVVNELADLEVFFVNLSGGEPFSHPDIARFLRFAHSKFRHAVVLTNGTLLRRKHMEAIADIVRLKGGFPIQVSIDSTSPSINQRTRSDVSKILENLRTLHELGADIVIAMVISHYNFSSLVASIAELSQYTSYFHLMAVQPVRALKGADKDHLLNEDVLSQVWDDVRKLKVRLGLHIDTPEDTCEHDSGCASGAPCMAGFSQIVIDPSMKVRPCDRCVQTLIGDLNKETIKDIWEGWAIERVLKSPVPFCQLSNQRILLSTS